MTTIEEFSSDSSDDDYVPGVEEAVSEDDQSGEEEDNLNSGQAADATKGNKESGKRKRKNKTANVLGVRKRKGGIKLDDDADNEAHKQDDENEAADNSNTQLSEEMKKDAEQKKELDKKQRVDSLWADFLKDTGSPASRSKSGPVSVTSQSKCATSTGSKTQVTCPPVSGSNNGVASKPARVSITQEFDFAGETVKITKQVDVNSKEAKQQDVKDAPASKTSPAAFSGVKRPGGGLGNLLGKIGKKPKIGTLEKSQLDWNTFKREEGLEEDLQVHNRGKEGYLERQAFLDRADHRQYELEKSVRLGLSKR